MSAATVRRAQAVHPIAALETEYGVLTREIEAETLPALRELGDLGRRLRRAVAGPDRHAAERVRDAGRLAGHTSRGSRARTSARTSRWSTPWRRSRPEKGATAAQLAIAWVLAQGEDIVPLIGARRRDRLRRGAARALDLRLTAEDLARIDRAVPAGAVAGDRYDAHGMKMVNR